MAQTTNALPLFSDNLSLLAAPPVHAQVQSAADQNVPQMFATVVVVVPCDLVLPIDSATEILALMQSVVKI